MTSISTWATLARKRRSKYPERVDDMNEDLQAIDAIENFLFNGKSSLKAARCIADIYEPRLKSRQRYDVGMLWVSICEAARSINGSASSQLAGLLLALRDQPDVVSSSGHVVNSEKQVLWRDLPEWGWLFREYGFESLALWQTRHDAHADGYPEIDPPDGNDAEWHAQAPQLLNITIFAANLMVRANDKPKVSFPASIAMDEGLDKPYDEARELEEEWRMYLPPAATWILIAGSKMRELSFTDQLPENDNQHSVRSRWGGRTYCPERWMFWKQRFQQLVEDTRIDARCRAYARQALEAMDKLDNES
ncbi:hypothetical protein E4T44_02040 [Aureobasidium sp. EXF-8845]|nr:hypothetical protein E4T44_02040 [Aureobasidium sp. EXF-8845]KAI4856485.1 hypothetical protein E4T45_02052 [Aureobasidium sp. EXF-8846]